MTFCDGNTSSYKINVVKFVISLALLNKKIYMNSELKKKKKKKKQNKRIHQWNGWKHETRIEVSKGSFKRIMK